MVSMKKVFIIAEAGVNHNGEIELAKKMIKKAAEAGADCIKFQTFNSDSLVCKNAPKATYQRKRTLENESQYQMLKKLELTHEMHEELWECCKNNKILFLSTPFDPESLEYLNNMDIPIIKIPSGEITNFPLLQKIGKTEKPVILSTGMSTIEEIEQAVEVLQNNGAKEISLLHCNTQYPTPFEDVNLKAMVTLKEKFNLKTGYSDHTPGIEVAIAAVAMGAEIIEKHFTLDKNMIGPDHFMSLEPEELKTMVSYIRNIEKSIGDGIKRVSLSEEINRNIVRKSIVAKCKIKKGDYFSKENLTTKRPGNGISPMEWEKILGTRAERDYKEDEQIVI